MLSKNSTAFREIAGVFEKLEQTSSSLAMIDLLAGLFARVSPKEARMAAYLMRGKVSPDYEGSEFGLAEKLVQRALAQGSGRTLKQVEALYKKAGDLGDVAQELQKGRGRGGLKLQEVFSVLEKIARAGGEGSQEEKVGLLAELLSRCSPLEAKYAVRIVLGTLRLGVGEMTFLYGLSHALTGSKEGKKALERAYNVLSDLGAVAEQAVRRGVKALEDAEPEVGVPVRVMLAQRVKELSEVSKHIPGAVEVEYKYDGERVQAHISRKGGITLFSRKHENITHQFPELVEALRKSFRGKEAIAEGEAVAVDKKTGRLKDFQTLMRRRRKHDVVSYVKKVPVKLFLFDLLSLDGKSLLQEPLAARKKALEKSVRESAGVVLARSLSTKRTEEMEDFFAQALAWGAEGVMLKSAESPYEAGSRGWNWIKFKRDYQQGLADTFDLVAVGALHGAGRRGGTYGSLLVAAFDPKTNKYYSFTKVGAGFTDEELAKLPGMFKKDVLKAKHRLVETGMEPDVWFEPRQVLEVQGAEITASPVHTVAKDKVKRGGLALRFPRFIRWRPDKKPAQATTVREIYEMYKS